MALDFPASPSVNQTYSGPGGVVWVWDGAKWVSGTGSTVYAPVTSPVFLGDPQRSSAPALGDSDSSVPTTQWVQQTVAPAFNGVGRSYIHNGLFNIAQRGTGPWTVSGYGPDRWAAAIVTDTASFSVVALSDADRTAIGDEEANSAIQNVFTGNAAAGAFHQLTQKIENVRRLANKTITISFWAKAAAGTPKIGIATVQYFGTGGSPSAAVRTLTTGNSVTLSTSWARYSSTIALGSISGKTLGTNADHSAWLELWFSSGATNSAAGGNIGVQSGTIQLWGVQLEIGSVATPLEKPDPQQDLAKCQRFYEYGNFGMGGSGNNAGNGLYYYQPFAVTKRATPTMAMSGQVATNVNSPSLNPNSAYTFQAYGTLGAPGGYVFYGNYTASADL